MCSVNAGSAARTWPELARRAQIDDQVGDGPPHASGMIVTLPGV
jgi:hypothetical protein